MTSSTVDKFKGIKVDNHSVVKGRVLTYFGPLCIWPANFGSAVSACRLPRVISVNVMRYALCTSVCSAWYSKQHGKLHRNQSCDQHLLHKEFEVKCNKRLLDSVECSAIVLGRQLGKDVGAVVLHMTDSEVGVSHRRLERALTYGSAR